VPLEVDAVSEVAAVHSAAKPGLATDDPLVAIQAQFRADSRECR